MIFTFIFMLLCVYFPKFRELVGLDRLDDKNGIVSFSAFFLPQMLGWAPLDSSLQRDTLNQTSARTLTKLEPCYKSF